MYIFFLLNVNSNEENKIIINNNTFLIKNFFKLNMFYIDILNKENISFFSFFFFILYEKIKLHIFLNSYIQNFEKENFFNFEKLILCLIYFILYIIYSLLEIHKKKNLFKNPNKKKIIFKLIKNKMNQNIYFIINNEKIFIQSEFINYINIIYKYVKICFNFFFFFNELKELEKFPFNKDIIIIISNKETKKKIINKISYLEENIPIEISSHKISSHYLSFILFFLNCCNFCKKNNLVIDISYFIELYYIFNFISKENLFSLINKKQILSYKEFIKNFKKKKKYIFFKKIKITYNNKKINKKFIYFFFYIYIKSKTITSVILNLKNLTF